jgi:hypothetical protein
MAATDCLVSQGDGRDDWRKCPFLGLCGPWRFFEKAAGTACLGVCFRKFRGGTFDTKKTVGLLKCGYS